MIYILYLIQQYNCQLFFVMSQLKEATPEAIQEFIINVKMGFIHKVRQMLQEYKSNIVNSLDSQTRQSPLYFASILIDAELSYNVMKLLIDNGADVAFKDNYQQTALFYVCREGKQKCFDLLLDHGLNLDDEDVFGQTPLFYVAKENRLNIIHKLLAKKVDINHSDKISNQTPIFYAAKQGNLDICKILINAGADLSHQDFFHKLCSYYAKKHQKIQVYEYLTTEHARLKENKKILPDNKDQSNQQQKNQKSIQSVNLTNQDKIVYRLYKSDHHGDIIEVSASQLDFLFSSYPDLLNMIKNPEKIILDSLEQIKTKSIWVKHASTVLTTCMREKGAFLFNEPIDHSKQNINGQLKIRKQSLDFRTINRKLSYNVYENIDEFIVDMNYVFENSTQNEESDSTILKHAIDIKNIFTEKMKQLGYNIAETI